MLQMNRETGIYCAFISFVTGLIIWLNFRPLGLFFMTNLVILLCRKYADLTIEISPKITDKLKTIFFNMLELREEKPGLFCGIISTVLVILALIGHIISGTYIVIVLLILALFIANKYEIRIVADQNKGQNSSDSQLIDNENEEFMPEINEANISLLKSVGEEADVSAIYKSEGFSDRKTDDDDDDDTYNDLMIPQNSIKEVDEDDKSSESSSEDLISNEIKFKSGHFNANSSSSDDDSISRGLSFHDIPDSSHRAIVAGPPIQQVDPLTNLLAGSVLNYLKQSIVSSQQSSTASAPYQSQPQNVIKKNSYLESSDDSDFEILNTDELSNS